jgi:hypothetical protein
MTDDLKDVLAELMNREPLFHRTELGTSREVFETMTAPDFWEVGASGTVYDLESIWSILEARYRANEPDNWKTSDFQIRALGTNVYLLTYQLQQEERITRRATLWEKVQTGWRVIYHQDTLV